MSWQYHSIIVFIIFFPKSLYKPTVACHKCFVFLQKVCDEPLWTNNIYCVQTCTLFHFIFVTHFVAQFLKAVFSSQNMWRNVPYLFIIVWELVFIFHKCIIAFTVHPLTIYLLIHCNNFHYYFCSWYTASTTKIFII